MIGAGLFIGMCLGIWIGWRASINYHTKRSHLPAFLLDLDA